MHPVTKSATLHELPLFLQKYRCLHLYLSTKFQVADPEVINYWHFDMRTLLKDIYLVPKFPTGSDNEDEVEESSDDGIE